MSRNLGATPLRRKRTSSDPMRRFDALPQPLRHWLQQAALPWSPASAQRIWDRALARGLGSTDAIALLRQAEIRTLAREQRATSQPPFPTS